LAVAVAAGTTVLLAVQAQAVLVVQQALELQLMALVVAVLVY
jgi:hypothetical protein